jgi:hypothetical protein
MNRRTFFSSAAMAIAGLSVATLASELPKHESALYLRDGKTGWTMKVDGEVIFNQVRGKVSVQCLENAFLDKGWEKTDARNRAVEYHKHISALE